MMYSLVIALLSLVMLTDPALQTPAKKPPVKLGPSVYRDSVNHFQFDRPFIPITDFRTEVQDMPEVKAMYLGKEEVEGKVRPTFMLQMRPPSPNIPLSQESDVQWLRTSGFLREEKQLQLDKFPAVIFTADQPLETDTLRYISLIAYTPTCTINLTGMSSISEFKKYEASFMGAIMSLRAF